MDEILSITDLLVQLSDTERNSQRQLYEITPKKIKKKSNKALVLCPRVYKSQQLTINNNRQQILDWNVRRRNTDTSRIIDYY
jgi:hypothetical protein